MQYIVELAHLLQFDCARDSFYYCCFDDVDIKRLKSLTLCQGRDVQPVSMYSQ